jgi:hypothetical protein
MQGLFAWSDRRRQPREVSTLDSCVILIDRRHGLRFDEATFNTFHCVVEDYCMQARSHGLKSYVAPGITVAHFGSTAWETPGKYESWTAEFREYLWRLEGKWPGQAFCTVGGMDSQSMQLREAFQHVKGQLAVAETELVAMRYSRSFRLGRLLTSPGRALRQATRRSHWRSLIPTLQKRCQGSSGGSNRT